jgi:hypothetical protein
MKSFQSIKPKAQDKVQLAHLALLSDSITQPSMQLRSHGNLFIAGKTGQII